MKTYNLYINHNLTKSSDASDEIYEVIDGYDPDITGTFKQIDSFVGRAFLCAESKKLSLDKNFVIDLERSYVKNNRLASMMHICVIEHNQPKHIFIIH